jgi:hypothetical protein
MPNRLYEVLRPVQYNNGRNVPASVHARWEGDVLALTGGLTIMGRVAGQWRDPISGKVYREPMQPVRIACTREQALQIARMTKTRYKQKAVMCYPITSEVTFI